MFPQRIAVPHTRITPREFSKLYILRNIYTDIGLSCATRPICFLWYMCRGSRNRWKRTSTIGFGTRASFYRNLYSIYKKLAGSRNATNTSFVLIMRDPATTTSVHRLNGYAVSIFGGNINAINLLCK